MITPARQVAYRVVRRVFDEDAWADRAFRGEADRAGLDSRERAFSQQLAYGTVQRRMTLDYAIEQLASRPLDQIDSPVRDALRLGLFQLLFLDVPDHAAVSQTVEMVGPRARGFANGVLRNAARRSGLLDDAPPAVRHSHPDWLVEMWTNFLGEDEALALLERDNEPAESAIRANTLATTRDDLAQELAEARPRAGELVPEALVLDAPFDAHGSEAFHAGRLIPQARSSMLVSHLLDPQPGERVLDMCAAPGAKTTHLAALTREGTLVAVERDAARADALRANCERMHAHWVEVINQDAREPASGGPFDRILLDAPCSDLGTLQSRPDARWRKDPAQIEELAALQRELLDSAAAQLAPGGVLVYATCTISPSEGHELLHTWDALVPDDLGSMYPELRHPADSRFLQLLPHRHGTDGFFVARLRTG